MERKRIFVAINISDEARQAVVTYIRSLRLAFPDVLVRWESGEKLHITLKFAGSIDRQELDALTSRVDAAATTSAPFSITVGETGAFVKRSSRSNVLWLGLHSQTPVGCTDQIGTLAGKIEDQMPIRRFRPHLTIARLKDAKMARG